MYALMHSTCQNGTAISAKGSAQAPIVLPILATALCDLPQSRVPPLCCVSFWPATTRRIYTNTRARAESRMHNRVSTYSIARTQIRENMAIPTAAHVFTKNTSDSHMHPYATKTLEGTAYRTWSVFSHAPLFRSMLEFCVEWMVWIKASGFGWETSCCSK